MQIGYWTRWSSEDSSGGQRKVEGRRGSSRRLLGRGWDKTWMDHAACAKPYIDPDIFFPKMGERTTNAKKVCARCPVRMLCRKYSINARIEFGVWGGLDEETRAILIRRRDESNRLVERRPRLVDNASNGHQERRPAPTRHNGTVIVLRSEARSGADTSTEGSFVLRSQNTSEGAGFGYIQVG